MEHPHPRDPQRGGEVGADRGQRRGWGRAGPSQPLPVGWVGRARAARRERPRVTPPVTSRRGRGQRDTMLGPGTGGAPRGCPGGGTSIPGVPVFPQPEPPAMDRPPVPEPARFCAPGGSVSPPGTEPAPPAPHRALDSGSAPIPLPKPRPGTEFPERAPSLDSPATAPHRERPTVHRAPLVPPARCRPCTEPGSSPSPVPVVPQAPVTPPAVSRFRTVPSPRDQHRAWFSHSPVPVT